MKVFSREKFIKTQGESEYKRNKVWVDKCDGKTKEDCFPYGIDDIWCIEVPDQKKEEKKVYTMKDFREKKIAVRVGTKNIKEFLQMCEAEGLRWKSGEKATEFAPELVNDHTAITENSKYGKGTLMYTCDRYFQQEDIAVINFEDFAKQTAPARYKITIECDGTTTTARMEVNGKEVRKAQAKRNPADKFSWRVGAETHGV